GADAADLQACEALRRARGRARPAARSCARRAGRRVEADSAVSAPLSSFEPRSRLAFKADMRSITFPPGTGRVSATVTSRPSTLRWIAASTRALTSSGYAAG